MDDDIRDMGRALSVIMVAALLLTMARSYILMIVLGVMHSIAEIVPPLGFAYSFIIVLLADFISSMIRFNSKQRS